MNEGVMKMKMYIESLRLSSSSSNQKGPHLAVETITRFLGISVTSAQLITIIDLRSKQLDLFGKAIQIVSGMINTSDGQMKEALQVFNKVFRKDE